MVGRPMSLPTNKLTNLVRGYEKLEGILRDFSNAQLLPFSLAAADI